MQCQKNCGEDASLARTKPSTQWQCLTRSFEQLKPWEQIHYTTTLSGNEVAGDIATFNDCTGTSHRRVNATAPQERFLLRRTKTHFLVQLEFISEPFDGAFGE